MFSIMTNFIRIMPSVSTVKISFLIVVGVNIVKNSTDMSLMINP
jgi:hypothetical protein